jgi:predicted metal-dependent peptidase
MDRRLAAARVWAAARMPYLASAIFACQISPAPASGTIAVDSRWRLRADPEVVARVEVEQLGRLVVHLTAHLLRDHAGRAQRLGVLTDGRRARWNRAADAEINDDLAVDGCVPELAGELPGDLACEPARLAEHYFERGAEGPRRWDCGSGADGCPRADEGQAERFDGQSAADGIGPQQAQLIRLGVAAQLQRAAAQQPGSVPGGWLRWAEAVLPSRVDWRRVLAGEIRSALAVLPSRVDWRRVLAGEIRSALAAVTGQVDYSYRRPSRRAHLVPGVVMPRLQRPLPEVAIVLDTSGSMHEELLARALAEVDGVLRRAGLGARRIRVLAVDAEVQAITRAARAAQVVLDGGGGTDIGRGIEAAGDLRPRPSVTIVLTDGFTPWPEHPPKGMRVIVGLLAQGFGADEWQPPPWARTVLIE